MGTRTVDNATGGDVEKYNETTKNYEDMQKQAWTSKDVDDGKLQSFEDSFDQYVNTYVPADKAEAIRSQADEYFTSMHASVELQQKEGIYSDSAWEEATRGFDSILADLAPEGAGPVYSPLKAGAGADSANVDETNDGSNVDETNDGSNVDETDDGSNVDETDDGSNVDETDDGSNVDETDDGSNADETDDGENVHGTGGTGAQYGNNADYSDESDSGDESNYSVKGPSGSKVSAQADQSGVGWDGDLTNPANSAVYKGMSLEQLMADDNSLVGQQLRDNPDIVAAIKKVSAETGVPEGLLAAMCTQETNFNNGDISDYNDGYADMNIPEDQKVDAGVIQAPLWAMPGSTTAEKKAAAMDPYNSLRYFADEAVDTYSATGSWGSVANKWYSGDTPAVLDGAAAGGSDETHYVENVFRLSMGASDYYPSGGY